MTDNQVELTVCKSCTDTTTSGEDGIGGGERLVAMLQALLDEHPAKDRINIRPLRCLMACTRGCAASVAGAGKMTYLLADMGVDDKLAAMLLDFATLYSNSQTGITPNHEWPGRIGMHFIGRIPPAEPAPADWRDDGCNL